MGETVKLVNQIIIANVMIANAEALVFAERAGADLSAVRAVLAIGDRVELPPRRMAAENVVRRNASRAALHSISFAKTSPRHSTRHAFSNTRCRPRAWHISSTLLAPLRGDGALDYSAIVKSYERNAGGEAAAASLSSKARTSIKRFWSWTTSPRSFKRCGSIWSAADMRSLPRATAAARSQWRSASSPT